MYHGVIVQISLLLGDRAWGTSGCSQANYPDKLPNAVSQRNCHLWPRGLGKSVGDRL